MLNILSARLHETGMLGVVADHSLKYTYLALPVEVRMSPTFLQAVEGLLQIEGKFVDDAKDKGGKTNWGITERLARAYGYDGDMRTLPRATAVGIYHEAFWMPQHLDEVAVHSTLLAFELFESAVHMGTDRGVRFLQRSLNAMNKRGTLFKDIPVDGGLGRLTLAALDQFMFIRAGQKPVETLLNAVNALQGAFFIELAEKDSSQEDFVYGWFKRVSLI